MATREAIFQSEGRAALSRGFLVVGDAVAAASVQVVASAPAVALASTYLVIDHALARSALDAGVHQAQAGAIAHSGTIVAACRLLAPPVDARTQVALFRCAKGEAGTADVLRASTFLRRTGVRRAGGLANLTALVPPSS